MIFLGYSLYKKSEQFKRFSLLMIMLTSVSVLPVFLTGEPAEEVIEKLPGVSKSVVHEHEEFAEIAFVLTLLVSISSLLVLLTYSKPVTAKYGIPLVLIVSVIAISALGYTANLGGKIRHTELLESQ